MLGILWMLYSGKKDAELKKNSTKEETSNNNNDFASVQDFGVAK